MFYSPIFSLIGQKDHLKFMDQLYVSWEYSCEKEYSKEFKKGKNLQY